MTPRFHAGQIVRLGGRCSPYAPGTIVVIRRAVKAFDSHYIYHVWDGKTGPTVVPEECFGTAGLWARLRFLFSFGSRARRYLGNQEKAERQRRRRRRHRRSHS